MKYYEVTYERGCGFVLRGSWNGQPTFAVTAQEAQLIQDYANSALPAGTIIQWNVLPPVEQEEPKLIFEHGSAALRASLGCLQIAIGLRLLFEFVVARL